MDNRRGGALGMGSVSILAIFVVLCLTTLAALSLVGAHADYTLAQNNARASASYYAADASAEGKLQEILLETEQNHAWQTSLQSKGYTVVTQGETTLVAFALPIDANRRLCVEVPLRVDAAGAPQLERRRWQVQVDQPAQSEAPLNLL